MSAQSYTPTAKALHWLMAAIWIAAWFLGAAAVYMREAWNPHHGLTITHKALASTLLFLIVARVAWRLTHPVPVLPGTMSPLMKRAAGLGHLALYAAALLALPLSGWIWSSVAGKPILVLGLFQLPPLTAPAREWYDLAKLAHVTLAWGTGALVLGHVLIALKHHFLDKDGILRGMLPDRRSAAPLAARTRP
ncbi:cytochrome b561 [Methylobacterium gregans]|uniref:Cytochrome b561 n=3 Tax=Methylobacterium gregans TaxID=374424 RepID=A0AA37HSC0_9HYPH|nr:cytochrome b [Methylobacterium gregans]MDQ0522313.1 cytochrome b561 [Methylobacterium gregans]GJD80053.1 Cytochrome b561 [Methylobacterium gregans]GLS55056.1 cytochrome b561 [Methylobacterium gregans]